MAAARGDGSLRIAAVEGGGTKFVCAVLSADTVVLEKTQIPTTSPEETLPAVRDWLSARGPFGALGIGCFGPCGVRRGAADYGRILATPKPGWEGADVLGALRDLAPAAAFASDVDVAALAERRLGAGRTVPEAGSTLAYVTVGTGIGAGLAQDGRILGGDGQYEFGHIGVPRPAGDNWPGVCPFHGDCAEGLASGPAIGRRWGRPLSALGPEHEAHALVAGYLAELCRVLFLSHRPSRIVLGGGVMKTPGLLPRVAALTEASLAGYLPVPTGCVRLADALLTPGLGEDAGIVGAGLIGLEAASGTG